MLLFTGPVWNPPFFWRIEMKRLQDIVAVLAILGGLALMTLAVWPAHAATPACSWPPPAKTFAFHSN
jgi:hypothetical protein